MSDINEVSTANRELDAAEPACQFSSASGSRVDAMNALVPLDTVAAEINARFERASHYEKQATEHRIAAGLQLIEVRKRVDSGEAGEVGWEKWCAEHINRSQGDIRKVMRIAGAVDPQAALEQERANAAAGMAEHRANVSAVDAPAGSLFAPAEKSEPEPELESEPVQSCELRVPVDWTGERLKETINRVVEGRSAKWLGEADFQIEWAHRRREPGLPSGPLLDAHLYYLKTHISRLRLIERALLKPKE
jgi:hypothetical protein